MALDPSPARQLTDREIAKIIGSVVGGLATGMATEAAIKSALQFQLDHLHDTWLLANQLQDAIRVNWRTIPREKE